MGRHGLSKQNVGTIHMNVLPQVGFKLYRMINRSQNQHDLHLCFMMKQLSNYL